MPFVGVNFPCMEHVFWTLWRSRTPFAFLVRGLLWPLSWPFAVISWVINKLYNHNILKTNDLGIKTVSIGNITVGGSGKTPFLLALGRLLDEKGASYAVVSRGYRSLAEKKGMVLSSLEGDVKRAGDEAQLVMSHLQNPLVFLGKDRLASLQRVRERQVGLALLDDGFQKRSLARDIDIVLLDKSHPFGTKAFLPSGFLRDHPSSLARADFLVAADDFDPKWIEFLRKFTKAPIIYTKTTYDIALPSDVPVALFAGIAAPERFLQAMQELQFTVVFTRWLKDHAAISKSFLGKMAFAAKEAGAKALVCTEKDYVKIAEEDKAELPLPLFVLHMKVNIDPVMGQQLLDKILS